MKKVLFLFSDLFWRLFLNFHRALSSEVELQTNFLLHFALDRYEEPKGRKSLKAFSISEAIGGWMFNENIGVLCGLLT